MTEAELLELCDDLLRYAAKAGADQAEAAAAYERSAATHLENGDVHTVETADETVFGVRVLVGESLGFVTANAVTPADLESAAAEAVEQARLTPADPFNKFPDPAPLLPVEGLFDPALADREADWTTDLAGDLVDRVAARDARVRIDSGSVSVSTGATAIRSTRGIEAAESGTFVQGYLFGMAVDGDEVASFDYDGESSRSADGIAATLDVMADRFTDKCVSALGAQRGESFKGAIVLSPEAVGEMLVGTLVSSLCADAVRKGRSPLAGRLSESIAVAGFSLADDGTLAGGVGSSSFDREGAPIGRHELIRGGELAGYLFNTYEANAAGAATTGHASGGASALPAIGTHYLEIAAGDTPLDNLLNPSDRAVLVNRFSGSTNPVTGDYSGVVKGGFLLTADGKTPIKEVLIQGNIFEALKNVSAISTERRLLGGTRNFPTLRIEDVSITAG